MCWMTQDLMAYFSSKASHDNYAEACPTTPLKPFQRSGICRNFRGKSNGSGFAYMYSGTTSTLLRLGYQPYLDLIPLTLQLDGCYLL
jgi:hypothetical protein